VGDVAVANVAVSLGGFSWATTDPPLVTGI
jgi:hypothetical protein